MITATFPRLRPARLLRLAALILTATVLLAPGVTRAQRPNGTMHWVGTWGAAPSSPTNNPTVPVYAYNGNNQFVNQTVRLIVHTSIAGSAVRIRLSNVYGAQALNVGAAHIAVRDSAANIIAGTDRALTFGGSPSIAIPNGADTLSDPVVLAVPALGDLAISLYLPGTQTVTTVHQTTLQTNYVSPANGGDATGATIFPLDPAAPTVLEWQLLTGVEVYVPTATTTVTCFGDSITDGAYSTSDTNRRWPDILAQRLQGAGMAVGVRNQGISGNQVVNDLFGANGEARFERDALVSGNAKYVIDLLGTNDIALTPTIDAAAIIAGKRQFIARAHALGLKIYGGTILSHGYAAGSDNENKRAAVNAFIRAPGNYDAVIDFEAATKDPANPLSLNPAYDSGDGTHPNDAGYQAMGNAIDLFLFQ